MSVKIFAKTVEQEVYDQLKQLMSVNVFRDAKVRIMPDTHAGKRHYRHYRSRKADLQL